MNISNIYQLEIEKAIDEFEDRNYATAIQILTTLIDQFPDEPEAYHCRCHDKYQLEDFDGALQDSDKLIGIVTDDVEVLYFNACLKIRLGRLPEAEEVLNRILMITSDHVETYYSYGFLKVLQGESDTALIMWGNALSLDPTHYETLAQRGSLYAQLGQEIPALIDFEKLPRDDNRLQSFVQIGKGFLNYYKKELLLALRDFEKAIDLCNENADAHFYRAFVNMELRNPAAEDDFLKANKYSHFAVYNAELILYMIINTLLMKDISRARMFVSMGLERFPESSVLWEAQSWVQFLSGKLEDSVISATRSITLYEKNIKSWYLRSTLKYLAGDRIGVQGDIKILEDLIEESPLFIIMSNNFNGALTYNYKDSKLLFLNGCILYKNQDLANAVENFRLAHEYGHTFSEVDAITFAENIINKLMDAAVTNVPDGLRSSNIVYPQSSNDGASAVHDKISKKYDAEDVPNLKIDFQEKCVKIGEVKIEFSPIQFAHYSAFASRASEDLPPLHIGIEDVDSDHYTLVLKNYEKAYKNQYEYVKSKSLTPSNLQSHISRINKQIEKSLANNAIKDKYIIMRTGKRHNYSYSIQIPFHKIDIVPD